MKRKIMGVTVGTSISPQKIEKEIKPIKTVNGKEPDENGNVDVEVEASGVGCEIPYFDLAALGMPTIDRGGETKLLETDTAEIMAALDKGVVKFTVALNFSSRDVQHDIVMNAVKTNGNYFCAYTFNWYDETFLFTLDISVGLITGYLQLVTMRDEQEESNPSYSITIDSELSLTSENPVQNKVVAQEFQAFGQAAADFNSRLTALEQGGIGGVSSWNDLTDKPFYEEVGTIFEGEFQHILGDDDGDGVGDMWLPSEFGDASGATIEVGKTYTLTWDGVEYECECFDFNGLPAVGNTVAMGDEDNGCPVAVVRDVTGAFLGGSVWFAILIDSISDLTGSGLHICKIERSIVKQLDNKYLEPFECKGQNEPKYLLKEEYLPFDAIAAYIDNYINEALGGDY